MRTTCGFGDKASAQQSGLCEKITQKLEQWSPASKTRHFIRSFLRDDCAVSPTWLDGPLAVPSVARFASYLFVALELNSMAAVKRIMREMKELSQPTDTYAAFPLDVCVLPLR